MNYVALQILRTNTKEIDRQLRRFDKAYQRQHNQKAQEGARISKGPVTHSEPQQGNNNKHIGSDAKTQRKHHNKKIEKIT